MFPVTITLHDAAQLNAVVAALSAPAATKEAAKKSMPPTAAALTPSPVAESVAPPAPAVTTTPTPSAASPSEAVTFDQLKKAFLSLSTKDGGRAKCEGVLKPFGLAKLSEAKDDQYAAVLAAIEKASA
jgi:hypothetical protein